MIPNWGCYDPMLNSVKEIISGSCHWFRVKDNSFNRNYSASFCLMWVLTESCRKRERQPVILASSQYSINMHLFICKCQTYADMLETSNAVLQRVRSRQQCWLTVWTLGKGNVSEERLVPDERLFIYSDQIGLFVINWTRKLNDAESKCFLLNSLNH